MIEPQYLSWVPFVGMTVGDAMQKPIITQYVEKAVIAAISALVVVYVNDKTQDKDIINLTVQITELKADVKELRKYILENR